MTDYEVARENSQILKMSEETNTPQRSILDFFKTPPKNLTTKPKDLLGFFCKKENNAQTLGISCNGKDTSIKENVSKKTSIKNEGKTLKKRKRTISKDQESDEDDGENKKTAPRKNLLKRKKGETTGTKVSQEKVEGNKACETKKKADLQCEEVEENVSETSNKEKGIKEDRFSKATLKINGEEIPDSCVPDQVNKVENTSATGLSTPPKGSTERGEEGEGQKMTQGTPKNLEWNKRIDIEKCRTPKEKTLDKSTKKKNKLKKKKKEPDAGKTVSKSLNLSDICTNMADVSILSDGGMNTSHILNGDVDIGIDLINKEIDKKEETNVTEVSYQDFLSKAAHMEDDKEDDLDETDGNWNKQGQKTSHCMKEDQQRSEFTDNSKEGPGTKTRGRHRKSNQSSAAADQKEAVSGNHVVNDKPEEMENVKEVSYLDYLNTINSPETGTIAHKDSQGEDSQSRTVEVVSTPGVEDGTDIPMPKHYPSITNFFSKVGSDKKWQPAPPKTRNNVSYIKAIIHEPIEPPSERRGKEKMETKQVAKKANRSLKKHHSEEIIEVLSSEIIVLDDSPVDVKGQNGKKTKREKQSEELKPKSETKVLTEEEEAEKEKKNLFLHGINTQDKSVKQKTSQATLSFSKGGLQMSKAVKEPVEKSSEKSTAESTGTPEPERRKRGRPKGSFKTGIKETTPESPSLSSPNSSQVFEDGIATNKVEKSTPSLAERRKSLRQKYKVKLLQNQEPESPIRMKFIRCLKSSSGSSQDESLTPKSKEKAKRQSKAQQLLEKAKRIQETKKKSQGKTHQKSADQKTKGSRRKPIKGGETADNEVIEVKSDSETGDSRGRRRSSRLSDRQKSMKELEVVELDDEDTNDSCYTPTKPNRRAGSQKQGAAKKPEVKNIAPIFLKKKSNVVNSPVKRELDPEAEKLKRAFLMSGIPAELKQSATVAASTAVALYPPFPRDNHVQQRSCSKMWSVENVILKTVAGVEFCSKITQMWSLNLKAGQPLMNCQKKSPIPLQSEKFKENVVSCLLKEISQACPSFPTQKMYTILKEKQDEEVIEETEGKSKGKEMKGKTEKEKPRRSLRRRKEMIEIIDVGGSPESKVDPDKKEDKLENVLPALSWPEKYQPLHSSEMIGNSAVIKRLRAWLLEWKQCLDKEAKRAKLMMMKEKKKSHKEEELEEEWWADDASDFDLDSDSEGEGDRLCNTAMLTGPLGVGKTASVYALAQELGFKVFEVNASSSRNGKRILAQLQEATQSQQVSKHHFSGAGTPKKHKNNTNADVPSKPKPTFFTNLFKKAGNQPSATSHSTEVKEKVGRKKRKLEEDTEYKTEKEPKKRKKVEDGAKTGPPLEKKKSLNLSCTSLILFDEVDLVFEAFDKGFWAAVKNFMDSTKIPIILTSNDSSLPQKFDGRFEQYKFRVPPMIPTSCYLRLVALTENIRMDWDEIVNLVSIFNSDIRRVLLTLQLWVNSGGGQKVRRSIKERETPQEMVTNLAVIDENSCSQDMLAVSKKATRTGVGTINDDDDDDFVSIKPIACKRQQLISDDESSNLEPPTGEKVLMEAQKCPPVNISCLESMLGLPINNENGILGFLNKTLQDGGSREEELAILACQQYLKLKVDLLYGHHLDMLPLNKVTVENLGPKKEVPSPVKTKRRRIKMTSDLYDSEGSDSESTDVAQTSAIVEETPKHKKREENSPELVGALSGFADFYDSISFTDTMRSLEERIVGDRNSVNGMTEDPLIHEHSELWMQDHLSEVCASVQWASLSTLNHRLRQVTRGLVQDERFTIPVLKGRTSTLTQGIACPDTRSRSTIDKAYSNVMSSLPLSVPRAAAMCDYLPYLRSITRDEQIRQAAKLKRRFHHYFDQIGLSLKDQTLEILNLSLS